MADFTLQDVKQVYDRIRRDIVVTPVLACHPASEIAKASSAASVALKLELMQIGGSFKIRGALSVLANFSDEQLRRGVTAVSAGNHAIAVSIAAKSRGVSAKVVMLKRSNPARVDACRSYGAEIVQADDVHEAFRLVDAIAEKEKRIFVHPYEGRGTALGTATLGYEFLQQAPDVDTVIVPIGGGGLAAGVATAVKMMKPGARVYGVEPFGADSMYRSFAKGSPQGIEKVDTIADSLGAPSAQPYSFALCRDAIDEIVRVSDDELRAAMRLLFRDAKLAVEPAGAAATAALCGPLKELLKDRHVGVIVCGA
ncbi:MAG: pyridoxal-phosphate dependent enzyme, partial [Proteobacteria bacterium]|nr:pyridoxal-phosphate dependent enzyme [Pseudomonadota bacterium]